MTKTSSAEPQADTRMPEVTRPTLLLDEAKCRDNIARMAAKASRLGISLRPHFKTHQSLAIGRWLREAGVTAITVSSVRMAEYFSADGWDDITVAFPANPADAAAMDALARRVELSCLLESPEAAGALGGTLEARVGAFVKVDTGYGRTGIPWDDEERLAGTVDAVDRAANLELRGFLAHAGHTYRASSVEEIVEINRQTVSRLAAVGTSAGSGRRLVTSMGDTPSCSLATDFEGASEMRPGNYVFNDMQQVILGSCGIDAAAVALACPVVATHPGKNAAIIHGGAVHLSKDTYRTTEGDRAFGQVVRLRDGRPWEPVEGARVTAVSQEHGTIFGPGAFVSGLAAGDVVGIIPAHSCLTANLARGYVTLAGDRLDHMEGRDRGVT